MALIDIVVIVMSVITLVNLYLVIVLHQKTSDIIREVGDRISDIHIDAKISSAFSANGSGSTKSMDDLAGLLFRNVKSHFNLESRSYSDIIEDIKLSSDISADLKESLVDFFTNMIHISYRKNSISPEEEEDFKKKTKVILRRLKEI